MSIEKHVMNVQNEKSPGNHEKMRRKAAEIFLTYDLDEMADKLGIDRDEEYLYITMLSRSYRIKRSDGLVEWASDGTSGFKKAGFSESMTLYDLIAYSKPGARPSGEYTKINNLADTVTGQYYAGKGMVDEMSKEFEGRGQDLARACEALGGTPYGRGDVSYMIPIWNGLFFVVSFWDSDEEFPPQLNVFTDTAMRDFIHYETIWYLEGHLMDMIRHLMC